MTNYSSPLDLSFQALADPTRRKVIERLSLGPASVTELAEPFDMALPSFLQHLKVLESAGLVISEKQGRVRRVSLVRTSLLQTQGWLNQQLNLWSQRLDQLDDLLEDLKAEENAKHKKSNET